MISHTKAVNIWHREHSHDPWVKRAQKEGYRSRAAYKLLEINQKDHLIKPGAFLVDLGAAPGSWSQVAVSLVGRSGKVLAIDLLPMAPIGGVEFICGDFQDNNKLSQLVLAMDNREPSLVISDMAPNISGNSAIDQVRVFSLAESALAFAKLYLQKGGAFVVKVFQGDDFPAYLALMRETFDEVVSRKPKASKDASREIFLIGKGKHGYNRQDSYSFFMN